MIEEEIKKETPEAKEYNQRCQYCGKYLYFILDKSEGLNEISCPYCGEINMLCGECETDDSLISLCRKADKCPSARKRLIDIFVKAGIDKKKAERLVKIEYDTCSKIDIDKFTYEQKQLIKRYGFTYGYGKEKKHVGRWFSI